MFNPDPGFFTNLNTTKAWFGGVSIEELDRYICDTHLNDKFISDCIL